MVSHKFSISFHQYWCPCLVVADGGSRPATMRCGCQIFLSDFTSDYLASSMFFVSSCRVLAYCKPPTIYMFFTRLGFQFFSGILHRQAFTDIKVFILLYGFRKVNAVVIVGAFFICFPYSFGCLDFQSLFCLPPSNERKLFHCSSIGIFLSVSSALSEDKSFSFLISLLK